MKSRRIKGGKKCLLNALMIFLIALFLTALLEFRFFRHNFGATGEYIVTNVGAFLTDLLIILLIVLLLYGLTRRLFIGAGIFTLVILVVTQLSINKAFEVGAELEFSELFSFSKWAEYTNTWSLVWLGLIAVVSFLIFWSLDRACGEVFRIQKDKSNLEIIILGKKKTGGFSRFLQKHAVIKRASMIIASIIVLVLVFTLLPKAAPSLLENSQFFKFLL